LRKITCTKKDTSIQLLAFGQVLLAYKLLIIGKVAVLLMLVANES